MALVLLRDTSGKDVYVNPDHVVAIQPYGLDGRKSYLFTTARNGQGGHMAFTIDYEPAQTAALLD